MDYSKGAYDSVVENGYPEEKVVMGMLMGQDFEKIQTELKNLKEEYGNAFECICMGILCNTENWSKICNTILNS